MPCLVFPDEICDIFLALHKHFVCGYSGGSRGGAQGPLPPPLFLDQMRPEGPKKFSDNGPPYLRVLMTPPHPPPYLKVWIRHWAKRTN